MEENLIIGHCTGTVDIQGIAAQLPPAGVCQVTGGDGFFLTATYTDAVYIVMSGRDDILPSVVTVAAGVSHFAVFRTGGRLCDILLQVAVGTGDNQLEIQIPIGGIGREYPQNIGLSGFQLVGQFKAGLCEACVGKCLAPGDAQTCRNDFRIGGDEAVNAGGLGGEQQVKILVIVNAKDFGHILLQGVINGDGHFIGSSGFSLAVGNNAVQLLAVHTAVRGEYQGIACADLAVT